MYSIDQDYDTHIWQLIIRARYEFELDAMVATLVARSMAEVAPREIAAKVTATAFAAVQHEEVRTPAPPTSRLAALDLVADWDGDLCPRIPWPRPHHDDVEELGDPMFSVVLARSIALVSRAGSEQLRGALGGMLGELAGSTDDIGGIQQSEVTAA